MVFCWVGLAWGWFEGRDGGGVDGCADEGFGEVGGAVHGGGGGGFRAVGDFDAAGELRDEASDGLVDLGWAFGAVLAEGVGLRFAEDGAVGDLAKVVGSEAVGGGVSESVLLPAVLEISVEAVAGRVALGEDEEAVVSEARDEGDVIEDFEEDVWDLDGVGGWANAVVDGGLIGDV